MEQKIDINFNHHPYKKDDKYIDIDKDNIELTNANLKDIIF